jgi:hypothetical protein
MSPLCAGSELIDGMRIKPKSSSRKRSLLASIYSLGVVIICNFIFSKLLKIWQFAYMIFDSKPGLKILRILV